MDEAKPQLSRQTAAQPRGVVVHHVPGGIQDGILSGQVHDASVDFLLSERRQELRHTNGEVKVSRIDWFAIHLLVQPGIHLHVVPHLKAIPHAKVLEHGLKAFQLDRNLIEMRSSVARGFKRHPIAADEIVPNEDPVLTLQHALDAFHEHELVSAFSISVLGLGLGEPSPQKFIHQRVHSRDVARQRLPEAGREAPLLLEAPPYRQQLRPDAQHVDVLVPAEQFLERVVAHEAIQQTLAEGAHPSVLLRPHVEGGRHVGDFFRKRKHAVREELLARKPFHLDQPLAESCYVAFSGRLRVRVRRLLRLIVPSTFL
mmetsp:Transcript_8607/g.15617  ORF Transcript_8607/g.15617 Transcript_8607/m.15617 type:complete len:314 (-) Transcript_8607:7811-8752(-)